jgi:thiol-disulfide isomerase/thioredoxin
MRRFRLGSCVWLLLAVASPAVAWADRAVEGQIVCSGCWSEADRSVVAYGTPADLDCAARCAKDGIPPALAVRSETGFELREIAGDPPGGGPWLAWIGKYVRAETADAARDEPRVRVVALEPLAASPWALAGPDTGEPATLSWTDLRGKPLALDRHRGSVVVLNFWATWCRPCIEEMPVLSEVRDRFAPYGVVFVGAAANGTDDAETVVAFVREHGIDFPVVLGATTPQMTGLGLSPALPGTVVLDEEGEVVASFSGVVKRGELERALEGVLGLGKAERRAARDRTVAHAHGHDHGRPGSLVPS